MLKLTLLFIFAFLLMACGNEGNTDTNDNADPAGQLPATLDPIDNPSDAAAASQLTFSAANADAVGGGRPTLPPAATVTDAATLDPNLPTATDRPTLPPFPTSTPRPTFAPTVTPDPDVAGGAAEGEAAAFSLDEVDLIFESVRGSQFQLYGVPATGDSNGQRARLIGGLVGFNGFADVSRDGTALAFVSTAAGSEDIYVSPLAEFAPERVTVDGAQDIAPRFSPDATQLVFSSTRQAAFDLYLAPAGAGAGPTALPATFDPFNELNPVWTPGGGSILFSANREADDTDMIYRYDLGTDTITPLGIAGFITDIDATGTRILLEALQADGSYNLQIADINGSNVRTIASVENASERGGRFSPDGTQIAFYSDRIGNNEIYVVDINGGAPRNVSNNPAEDRRPAWVAR